MRTIETDCLVVGAGATGMAFTDALVADLDAQVVLIDRRHSPGGHWNDAYPFVRLHQPWITPQLMRAGQTPFNAALVGFMETTGRDDAEKNRLCPPNPFPRDDLQGLVGCDWVTFNWHDTPGRRLRHAQVVASGQRGLASKDELEVDHLEPFWRWYWHCEPCSLPDRVEAPIVMSISEFYTARAPGRRPHGPTARSAAARPARDGQQGDRAGVEHRRGNGPQAPRERLRATRGPEPYRGGSAGHARTGVVDMTSHTVTATRDAIALVLGVDEDRFDVEVVPTLDRADDRYRLVGRRFADRSCGLPRRANGSGRLACAVFRFDPNRGRI